MVGAASNALNCKRVAVRRLLQLLPIIKQHVQGAYCTAPSPLPTIQISPKVSQFDQDISIRVQGLPSHDKVTLHMVTENYWQRRPIQFVSYGHFVTGPAGEVDLEKDGSMGGTFTGVEPMGLFWSLIPHPSGPKNIRLVIKTVEKPVLYTLSVFKGHLSLNDLHDYQPISSLTVERVVKSPDVKRVVVKEGRVRGTLFLPPGDGPFQGVIDMYGLAGGLMEIRSALMASHGFATLCLPLFAYDDLPDLFGEQNFQYFEDSVRWLSSHPSVIPDGIGVIGTSGGAAIGLMMAYKCPEVRALVRINCQSFHSCLGFEAHGRQFKIGVSVDINSGTVTDGGLVMRDTWTLKDSELIPIWEKDVPLLAIVGDDDGQVYPSLMDKMNELYPEDRRHLIEVVHYPKAGHLIEAPYTPLCRVSYNPYFGLDMAWGGYVPEHADAQFKSWVKIQDFLRKHLPSSS